VEFNTAPLLEEFGPPVFVHEGRRFVGRHMSIVEWLAHVGELEKLGGKALTLPERLGLHRRLCDEWFPPPPRRYGVGRFRVGPRTGPSVGAILVALPYPVQDAALASFINSQVRALGLNTPALGTATGSSSTTAR
jgi:hypothetical protein